MHNSAAVAQMAYDFEYDGPQDFAQANAPNMLPFCDTVLIRANATARLAGGAETVDDAQARKHINPAKDCAIKKLELCSEKSEWRVEQDNGQRKVSNDDVHR
jgi:hypothetical protein